VSHRVVTLWQWLFIGLLSPLPFYYHQQLTNRSLGSRVYDHSRANQRTADLSAMIIIAVRSPSLSAVFHE